MAITGQSGLVVRALVTAYPGVRGLFPSVLAFNMFISSHYITDLSIQVNKLKFALTTHKFFILKEDIQIKSWPHTCNIYAGSTFQSVQMEGKRKQDPERIMMRKLYSETCTKWTPLGSARGGNTTIYGLYGYVPLWRVWFSGSLL